MSGTYKATGINLKSIPLGESDRIVTILTAEYGLVRAVAPGSRKQKSRLRGRVEPFVINELLIARGRSLDKITQAETRASYPGLSKNLGKLSIGQYWAEIVLALALSDRPQEELYLLFTEHLQRLERIDRGSDRDLFSASILAHLTHGIFHLLTLGGLSPRIQHCCLTGEAISPVFRDPQWRVGMSFEAGGLLRLPLEVEQSPNSSASVTIHTRLNALEIFLLQTLATPELPRVEEAIALKLLPVDSPNSLKIGWLGVEKVLRNYTQYHLNKSIRSAALLDTLYRDGVGLSRGKVL
ncbi:MAG: DNA repair protein RecO [Cyanobacteria bacterium SBLK]|nr:DNA repair protein RecO [Cyanobacteria bacterium SBLK]